MKKIFLSIKKPVTLREVAMLTAYIGVKHADVAEHFERLAVVKADAPLLETFWRDTCTKADHAFQEYLQGESSSPPGTQDEPSSPHTPPHSDALRPHDDDYHARLALPDNWDDGQRRTLEGALHAFFVHHVVARWLDIVMPEAENLHATKAEEQLTLLKNALEKRKRAPRPDAPGGRDFGIAGFRDDGMTG
ncbi:MAG: hypothetical protein J5529_05430 [Prevotella sp.]|nr:hypothetical protein [Prevotella sp.]